MRPILSATTVTLVLSTLGLGVSAWAGAPFTANATPGAQCRAAIERAERLYGIPAHLLAAIGQVESGRRGPDGRVDPWPYSINVAGSDTIFESRASAVAGVRALLAGGSRSIDVGCLQVNLMYHPQAFASLEEAFDPWRNADYAARFLVQLREQTGSWTAATANYHSATPSIGGPYATKVQAALVTEAGVGPIRSPAATPALFRPFQPGFPTLRPTASFTAAPGRLLGLASGAGRGLAAYRSNPVQLAPVLLRR